MEIGDLFKKGGLITTLVAAVGASGAGLFQSKDTSSEVEDLIEALRYDLTVLKIVIGPEAMAEAQRQLDFINGMYGTATMEAATPL